LLRDHGMGNVPASFPLMTQRVGPKPAQIDLAGLRAARVDLHKI
jgi:hypothetical protein